MDTTIFDSVWQDIVRRQFKCAGAIDKLQYPEINRQALTEVEEFSRLPLPHSGHELNIRRVRACSMTTNWQAEVNRTLSSLSK